MLAQCIYNSHIYLSKQIVIMKVIGGEGMARQARTISPTDYYHVIMRGNNRESIFSKQSQKQLFIDLLREQVEEGLIDIAGYCIMDNHVHIAIKAELDNLTKAMKSINIKYAMRFNKEKERIGHVFQDRYKSEIISNENNLIHVIRYIHNNPAKAKMVKSLSDYKWSSYNEFTLEDKSNIISNEQKSLVLKLSNGVCKFIDFHKADDGNEYLEIKEDRDRYRIEKAQEIIASYLNNKGIDDIKVLRNEPELLEEIVKEILLNSKLSHRKIADLLGVNNNTVHLINLKIS